MDRVHRCPGGVPRLAVARSNRLRARAFAAALLLGVLALTVSALRFRLGPSLGPGTLLYPLASWPGALVLGAVATGMLLGHWYLIDLGLSIEPLERLFRFFVVALVVQLGRRRCDRAAPGHSLERRGGGPAPRSGATHGRCS